MNIPSRVSLNILHLLNIAVSSKFVLIIYIPSSSLVSHFCFPVIHSKFLQVTGYVIHPSISWFLLCFFSLNFFSIILVALHLRLHTHIHWTYPLSDLSRYTSADKHRCQFLVYPYFPHSICLQWFIYFPLFRLLLSVHHFKFLQTNGYVIINHHFISWFLLCFFPSNFFSFYLLAYLPSSIRWAYPIQFRLPSRISLDIHRLLNAVVSSWFVLIFHIPSS